MDANVPPNPPQIISEASDFGEYLKPRRFYFIAPLKGDPDYVETEINDGRMNLNLISERPSLIEAITESQRLNQSGRHTFVLEMRYKAEFTGHTIYPAPKYSPLDE